MTMPNEPDRIDAHLWDPAAAPAADVQDLERKLEPLRFEPARTGLDWKDRAVAGRSRRRWTYGLVAAATVVLATGGLAMQWRWSWPAGRAWTVESTAAAVPGRLQNFI